MFKRLALIGVMMTTAVCANTQLRPKVGVGVFVINEEGQLLLGLRQGSHGEGFWACPGGHLEYGEDLFECAARELMEETGTTAESIEAAGFGNDMFDGTKHYVTLFTVARGIQGTIQNLEPEKCQGWEWFDFEALPEPLFPSVKSFLDQYDQASGLSLPRRLCTSDTSL